MILNSIKMHGKIAGYILIPMCGWFVILAVLAWAAK